MKPVEPTPPPEQKPPLQKIPPESKDKSAEQMDSKGGLLKNALSHFLNTLVHIITLKPLTGWIQERSEKKKILSELIPIFKNAYPETPEFVDHFIKPALQQLSTNELSSIFELNKVISISQFFSVVLKKEYKDSHHAMRTAALALSFPHRLSKLGLPIAEDEGKRRLLHFFATIGMKACKTFDQDLKQLENQKIPKEHLNDYLSIINTKVNSALLCDQFNELCGNRLSEKDGLALFEYFIHARSSLDKYQAFLTEAQKIKNQQPRKFIPANEASEFRGRWRAINEEVTELGLDKKFSDQIISIFKDTADSVAISNTQVIEDTLIAQSAMPSYREVPDLKKRNKTENSLLNGFQVNKPIEANGKKQTSIEIHVTNPVTMATTTTRTLLDLPKEDTQAYLKMIRETVKRAEGRPAELTQLLDQCEIGLAKAMALNDSRNRSGYDTAYESEAMRHYLSAPIVENALALIKEKSIFSLPSRKLSLLPKMPEDSKLRSLCQIENEALNILRPILSKNKTAMATLKVPLMEGGELRIVDGTITLVPGTFKAGDGAEYVTLNTEIRQDRLLISRTTYYSMKGSVEETLKQLVNSPLFERDLLLAKQEFIEKVFS
jgi:hypothetical protein